MLKTKLITKEQLFKLYCIDNLTRLKVASALNITSGQAAGLLKKYKIKKSKYNTKYYCNIDYNTFFDLYITKNLTCAEIEKITGYTKSQLLTIKNKFNLHKSKEQYSECMSRICSSDEFLNKVKKTNKEKFGVDFVAQNPAFMEKRALNTFKKYGVMNVMQVEEIQQKAKDTVRSTYGVDYVLQAPEIREKIKQTNNDKYGVENQFQRRHFKSEHHYRYLYLDHTTFDSSWELALYIYAKDHNEEIEREPISFTYIVNNKKHYYTPDFLYNGKLIEVKPAKQLKNSKLIDVYNNKDKKVLAGKQKCIETNNVVFVTDDQIKTYLAYIKDKYGPNYLKQFRNLDKK